MQVLATVHGILFLSHPKPFAAEGRERKDAITAGGLVVEHYQRPGLLRRGHLTCRLPFWQYSVTRHWLGESIHSPTKRTMWSCCTSRI